MRMTACALAERDVGLPALGLLFDDRLRARWLADHDHPEPITPGYLRYKPGTSLIVGFHTATGPIFGYTVTEEAAPKLDKLVGRAPAGSILVHDRQRRIVLAEPVADRDLPGLGTAAAITARPLAYKPQRRWVGMLPDQVLRCYRPATVPGILRRWPAHRPTGVRIPRLLDHDHRDGVLLVERVPGTPLHRVEESEELIAGLAAAGRALATWHRQGPPAPVPVDLPDLTAAAEQLELLVPDETPRIRRLAERLAAGTAATAEHGWCHGDFSADQVLVPDRPAADPGEEAAEPAILDWDRSGHGPLAVDLANADAAGLYPGRLLRPAEWQAILDGYRQLRPLPADLDLFRARARFARASEPFRTAQRDWPDRISAALDRVEELL